MKIEARKRKKGPTYRTRFTVSNTPFRSPWFATKEQAKNWSAEKRVEVLAGQAPTGAAMKVSAFAELWLEKHSYANKVASAALKDAQHLRKHILPKVGATALRNLTATQLDFLLSDIKRNGRLRPKTINNILGTVKKMLNDAVRWRYLSHNPAAAIAPLKVPVQVVTNLYHAEVRQLLAFSRERYPNEFELFMFAFNTGCRLGECLGLEWCKIDFTIRTVTIDSTYDAVKRAVVLRTKGKRFRKLPLNDDCVTLLRRLALEGRQGESRYIFSRINYDYLTHEKCKRIFTEAGLVEGVRRGATFHSTRHTFASEFMRMGGDIYKLQRILGHSTVQQTEKYLHFAPDYLAGETARISFAAPSAEAVSLAKI